MPEQARPSQALVEVQAVGEIDPDQFDLLRDTESKRRQTYKEEAMNDEPLASPPDADRDEPEIQAIFEILRRRGWTAISGGWFYSQAFGDNQLCLGYRDDDEDRFEEPLGPLAPRLEFDRGRAHISGAGTWERCACAEHARRCRTIVFAHYTRDGLLAQVEGHLARVEAAAQRIDPDEYVRCLLDGPCRHKCDQTFAVPAVSDAQDAPGLSGNHGDECDKDTADSDETIDDDLSDADDASDQMWADKFLVQDYVRKLRSTYKTIRDGLREAGTTLEQTLTDAQRLERFRAGLDGELSNVDREFLLRDITEAQRVVRNLYRVTEFHHIRVGIDHYQWLADLSHNPVMEVQRQQILTAVRAWQRQDDAPRKDDQCSTSESRLAASG
ncbi:MAG: hypothetical protein GEV04_07205 [Actinophytocola sp.]|nr:hypothetical protein [Actinophytocola sp.]